MPEIETERYACPTCGGDGYENVHAGVIECDNCDGEGSVEETERIKFAGDLIVPILDERKQATVRFDGYEDVSVGDTLIATTLEDVPFAELEVRRTATAPAAEVHDLLEVFGAEYPSERPIDVVDSLNEYYDDITLGTTVNVIAFEVVRHV